VALPKFLESGERPITGILDQFLVGKVEHVNMGVSLQLIRIDDVRCPHQYSLLRCVSV